MSLSAQLLDIIQCPRSKSTLKSTEGGLLADDGTQYPIINGVPWLLPTPQNSLTDWRSKISHFNQVLLSEIKQLETELKQSRGQSELRIQRLLDAKRAFIRRVSELLFPLVSAQLGSKRVYDALRDKAPSTQNLLSYEANFYRDWVWGEEENRLSCDLVCQQYKSDEKITRMVVLGAGAGRLALDLHRRLKVGMTVATDINPLLVLAANHLLAEQDLSIVEFPLHPRRLEYVAIEHEIKGIAKPEHFHFVFSDAAQPCFKHAAFDVVVTPWFIDIQPLEFGRFLKQLNHYIPVGGRWLNFGSLVFNQRRDALCYSIEEVKEIAAEQGFDIESIDEHEINYLKSPYNAGYRMERVWAWSAVKVRDVEAAKATQIIPPWLRDSKLPIPKASYFDQFSFMHRVYAQLSSEVDGKNTLQKIAKRFAKQNNMNEEEAENLVRQFFLDIYTQNN